MCWAVQVPRGILLLMSVFVVDGDFTPTCFCLWAFWSSFMRGVSFQLLSFLQSFKWRILLKTFRKSECICQVTLVDVFVNLSKNCNTLKRVCLLKNPCWLSPKYTVFMQLPVNLGLYYNFYWFISRCQVYTTWSIVHRIVWCGRDL